jgi:membrane-bound lytic murein transglycosylase D
MKKNYLFALLILAFGVGNLSCTRPDLKKASADSEERSANSSNDSDNMSVDSMAYIEEDFELDRLNEEPIEVYDSLDAAEDMTVAVDDYIYREMSIAREYYMMGVAANKETAWEEAEYYFEKALSILGNLDIDSETDSPSPEAVKYNKLLVDIIANYRSTLLSLGHLPSDISPDALMARFSDINHLKIDSTELKRLESLAQEQIAYNVPVILNERVKSCILYYQTVARDAFSRYLSRSTKFIPIIDSIFAEMGLPTDLKYLAMVESGFNPKAYSWARAMGLWQFIASTGRLYGLNRSWWYDERKDPVKSTIAAARFLKDLYDEFGSWELSMAAYNGGPGRVRRVIRKQKTTDFWKMRLKKQTMDYVPFFMAAATISKKPEKFGFTDIEYFPRWEYDEVSIDKCLDLKTIAREVGCGVDDLMELNPELLRRFTPPNVKDYKLRIPKGGRDKFLAAYDKMPSSKETSFVRHKIRRGETVSTIARRYGVSQYAIFEANNISRRSKIYAGKSLVIPVPNDRSYSNNRRRRNYEAHGNIYIVRSGDTVWDIARAFGKTPDQIRRLNKLDRRARIYVGQRLQIGIDDDDQAYAQMESKGKTIKHRVKKGDTLWDIARRYGTSTTSLRRLNGLGGNSRIYPGQVLLVSGSDRSGKVMNNGYQVYTVRKGDTLWEIASLYKTTVARLKAWNDVTNPHRIKAGDKLIIYTN